MSGRVPHPAEQMDQVAGLLQQLLHGFPRGEFTADTSDTEGL